MNEDKKIRISFSEYHYPLKIIHILLCGNRTFIFTYIR